MNVEDMESCKTDILMQQIEEPDPTSLHIAEVFVYYSAIYISQGIMNYPFSIWLINYVNGIPQDSGDGCRHLIDMVVIISVLE